MEDNEPSLKEKVDAIYNVFAESEKAKIKIKPIKLPRKARVRKGKLKKGYIGILRIDENRNIMPEKAKVEGSAFSDKNDYYHATDGSEIFFWQGKFPILIQPTWKLNPLDLSPKKERNETYGQPMIKALIIRDAIKPKKGGMSIIIWLAAIAGAIYLATKVF